MPAIEFSAVTRKYGRRTALDRVSFSLPEGASLGLLGPNGAGKTTALRTLLGLVRPTSGSARLQGLDPFDARARRGVGYLPERLALPGHMKVGRFLELHGRLAGLRGESLAAEVTKVAELTGIAARRGDRLGDLSKGLAQRVGFAQALLGEPRVLLLDEPNSGLDPIGMREARGWIAAARAWGCAVLISSHQLSEIGRLCDRIAILHDARVVAEGAIDTIVREGEELEDAFVRLVSGPAVREVGHAD
jgi:ABC-2 type transport system ATP-binding protein